MDGQTEPRTLLITGAAGALGSALAETGLRRGHRMVLLDRDRRGLEALYDRLTEGGLPEPILHPLDLASAGTEEFETLLEAITGEVGGLDGVVHGAVRFEGLTPVEHVAPPEWLHGIQVNLNAAWLLSAMSLPLLRVSPSGRLVFVLDEPEKSRSPLWGVYGICKHALGALALQFAATCESGTVRVHGVEPGAFRSSFRSRAYLAEDPSTLPSPRAVAERILSIADGSDNPASVLVRLAEND